MQDIDDHRVEMDLDALNYLATTRKTTTVCPECGKMVAVDNNKIEAHRRRPQLLMRKCAGSGKRVVVTRES